MNQDMHYIYFTGNTIIIELNSIYMTHLKQNTLEIYVAKYQLMLVHVATCLSYPSRHINVESTLIQR